ncbi:phage tail tape measure protein, partial [Bacillus pseudomycoides]
QQTQNCAQKLEAAKSQYGENSAEVNKLETKLLQLRAAEQQLQNEVRQANTALSEQANTASQASEKINAAGEKMRSAGETMSTTATPAILGLGAGAMKVASDMDASQRKIQASLGLTSEGAQNLEKIAESTWKNGFGENLAEVDTALIKVFQNMRDVPNEELQGATENVLTLAQTYDVDLNEATRGAGQLMSQFGLSTEETFDLLAAGAQEGLNYSDELFDNLSEYAPLFKQAGFTADEMFNILANGTRDGSYNLDYINDLIKEFGIRVQDGSKGVAEGFGELSQETQYVWASFNAGKATAADVFKAVTGDLKNMDDKVKANQIGVALMGTKFEDMGADAVLGLNELNGGLGKTKGAMDNMKKLQEEAFGQQFKSMLRELAAALEPLGKVLLSLAKDIMPSISSAVKTVSDGFNNLSPTAQKIIIIVGGIVAAIGPLLIILSSLAPLAGALAGAFGITAGAMLGWIAIIPIIIATVVGLVVAIVQNWDSIKEWTINTWNAIKEFLVG